MKLPLFWIQEIQFSCPPAKAYWRLPCLSFKQVTFQGKFASLDPMDKGEKILIIRFSSFGDVVQTLSVPAKIKEAFPQAQIHWLTRSDMAPLVETHPGVAKTWSYSRKSGLKGLLTLAWEMRQQNYTRIYDAHNNLRSTMATWILKPIPFLGPKLLRRSVKRWKRFLLFKFRINTFEMPFSGQRDLIEPLQSWGIGRTSPSVPQFFPQPQAIAEAKRVITGFEDAVALAPSAAYFLKRWPKHYWVRLIELMPDTKFICLGGPEDIFIEDIAKSAPSRVLNLAGKCNLATSSAIMTQVKALVANDTGLMHVGEQLGTPTIALMGPAPFGFPSRSKTRILELDLPCRPCSKHGQGPCVNTDYHKCLMGITPETVAQHLREIL